MFPFSPVQGPDDIRRMFNAELHLYNAVLENAVDIGFRLADLNLQALKQASANWSAKTQQLSQTKVGEGSTMPAWFDPSHLAKDLENFNRYGQQIASIMQDMQAGIVKVAQQRASQTWNAGGATPAASPQATAGTAAAINFMQDLMAQASKGYTQWSEQVLTPVSAEPAPLAKPRTRK